MKGTDDFGASGLHDAIEGGFHQPEPKQGVSRASRTQLEHNSEHNPEHNLVTMQGYNFQASGQKKIGKPPPSFAPARLKIVVLHNYEVVFWVVF